MNKDRTTSTEQPAGNRLFHPGWLLAGMLGILLVVTLLLAIWLLNDPQRIRPFAESWLSEVSGRQLAITGDFNLRIGSTSTLQASGIRWNNAEWGSHSEMLSIEELQVSVSIRELLSGELHLADVSVSGMRLILEWDNNARFNWDFSGPPKQLTQKPDPLPVFLQNATIENSSVVVAHPGLVDELTLDISRAVHASDELHRLVIDAQATLGNRPLEIVAVVGPLPELLVGGAVNFDAHIVGPHAELTGSGSFGWLAKLVEPSFTASFSGNDATEILTSLNLPAATHGLVDLKLQIDSKPAGIIVQGGGTFGEHSLKARLLAEDLKSFAGFDLDIEASGPSVGNILAIAGQQGLPDAPYTASVRAYRVDQGLKLEKLALQTAGLSAQGSGLIRQLPELRDIDLQLSVSGENLGVASRLFDLPLQSALPFHIDAHIAGNGKGTTDTLNVDVQLGSLSGSVKGSLTEADDLAGSRFSYAINTSEGNELAKLAGLELPPGTPFHSQGELQFMQDWQIQINAREIQVGTTQLSFNGTANAAKAGIPLHASISVSSDNMAATAALFGLELLMDRPFTVSTDVSYTPDAIVLDSIALQGTNATAGGRLEFSGQNYARISFDLQSRGESLQHVLPVTDSYRAAEVPFIVAAKGSFSNALIDLREFDAQMGSAQFTASGEITLDPLLAAHNVKVKGSGPSLADTGYVLGNPLQPAPFTINATMTGNRGKLLVDDLSLIVGKSDLQGRIHIVDADRPFIDIRLSADNFDLDELWAEEKPAAPEQSEIEQTDLLWFADDALPLGFTTSYNGKLTVSSNYFSVNELLFSNLSANATLQDGVLDVGQISLDMPTGLIRAKGQLRPADNGWQLDAELLSDQTVLTFDESPVVPVAELPRYAIDARVSATGSTPREMAASANGFAWMLGGQGKSPSTQLGPLFGDFLTQLINTINPFTKNKKYVTMDCQGLYFELTDGILETAPAAIIQSDTVTMAAVGKIDLSSEAIEFRFEATPRKGIGVSLSNLINPFTHVTGTLSQPQIRLSTTSGTVIEGGAAIATGGLTILTKSLWKRWFGSRQICQKIADEALKIRRQRDPAAVPDLNKMIAATE